jgi:hypothetical protein
MKLSDALVYDFDVDVSIRDSEKAKRNLTSAGLMRSFGGRGGYGDKFDFSLPEL